MGLYIHMRRVYTNVFCACIKPVSLFERMPAVLEHRFQLGHEQKAQQETRELEAREELEHLSEPGHLRHAAHLPTPERLPYKNVSRCVCTDSFALHFMCTNRETGTVSLSQMLSLGEGERSITRRSPDEGTASDVVEVAVGVVPDVDTCTRGSLRFVE